MKKDFILDLEIYTQGNILQAIGDFSEVTEITLTDTKLTVYGESEEDIGEIFREFMNYILSL